MVSYQQWIKIFCLAVSCTAVRAARPLSVCPQAVLDLLDERSNTSLSSLGVVLRLVRSNLFLFSSLQVSGGLLVGVALQLVELNTVQLLEPLVTELTGEVVVSLWSVFLHVPVQGRTLATLVAADLTSDRVRGDEETRRRDGGNREDKRGGINVFIDVYNLSWF